MKLMFGESGTSVMNAVPEITQGFPYREHQNMGQNLSGRNTKTAPPFFIANRLLHLFLETMSAMVCPGAYLLAWMPCCHNFVVSFQFEVPALWWRKVRVNLLERRPTCTRHPGLWYSLNSELARSRRTRSWVDSVRLIWMQTPRDFQYEWARG